MSSKISFYKENTVNINLTFIGVDLTGATVYFTIKTIPDDNATDTTAIIKKDVTVHTDALNGNTTISLTPVETDKTAGDYRYDIKLKKATGEQQTIATGKLEIKEVITNRASP